ncbi:phosphoribosyltransferase [Rahnella sp. PCH160]|uniref:phosphoribosyltransferase n=1 Tax=Rahnella sp. PCH160 TaxID=3447928 RepID=UPI0039FB8F1B
MGIDVTVNREVKFNDAHEHRVITGVHLNPKKSKVGRNPYLNIFSIYTRTKQGDLRRDGNPLIYALKSLNGFTITKSELRAFKPTFSAIVDKTLLGLPFASVLTMPSSSALAEQFGRRIARKLRGNIVSNAFCKRTATEILAEYRQRHVVPKTRHKSDVNRVLAELNKVPPNTLFSMKLVENNIREYFRPLKLNPVCDLRLIMKGPVLLVDDLLSTGTTLLNAREELERVDIQCHSAICLLSDL